MGNTVMVSGFELARASILLPTSILSFNILATMAERSGSKPTFVVTNYFASSSEDEKEKGEVEDLELPDFEPFYASYRRYRGELSPEELQQLMNNGLESIRENPLIIEIIRKMFDFDLEVGDIEKDVFFVLKGQTGIDLQFHGHFFSINERPYGHKYCYSSQKDERIEKIL